MGADAEAEHRIFMEAALEEAALAGACGEVPVGAVLVCGGGIVCRAHNLVEARKLGTAHAELLAIEAGSAALGMWRLDGCTLYVTKEPCFMCAGAMLNCRLPRLVFGCPDPRMGAAGGYADITGIHGALHRIEVIPGVLEDECRGMLQSFFRKRRTEVRYADKNGVNNEYHQQ